MREPHKSEVLPNRSLNYLQKGRIFVVTTFVCDIIRKLATRLKIIVKQNKEQINTSALLASVVGQVGCLIVFIVFIALGAGLLLDRLLGTTAVFTILFMVGSVPVALYLTVRLSLTAMNRAQIKLEEQKTVETNSDDINNMEDNTTA